MGSAATNTGDSDNVRGYVRNITNVTAIDKET